MQSLHSLCICHSHGIHIAAVNNNDPYFNTTLIHTMPYSHIERSPAELLMNRKLWTTLLPCCLVTKTTRFNSWTKAYATEAEAKEVAPRSYKLRTEDRHILRKETSASPPVETCNMNCYPDLRTNTNTQDKQVSRRSKRPRQPDRLNL
uniref:Uncharacterized protein n=1 Tax=Myripristis murdjan TaxID=586833 RepID=A0A667ZYW8_9TELE